MRTLRPYRLEASLLGAALFFFPLLGAAKPLVIATVPVEKAETQSEVFAMLSAELKGRLNQEVKFVRAASYGDAITKLGSKELDVALIGAAAYVEARKKGAKVIVKAVRNERADYRGAIIVRNDSPVKKLADLAGKTIAFVDGHSTAGYHYPLLLLRKAGLEPGKGFQVKMVGGHHKVVDSVAAKETAAGACYEGAWERLDTAEDLKALAYTDPIPGDAIVVRAGLEDRTVVALTAAFKELETLPEGEMFLVFAGIDRFVTATDADYDPVAAALR